MGKKRKCVGDDDDDDDEEEEDLLLLLPEDFLIQILVRLPVVSLLRFKSVSKSWCALIQTSFFIHLHNTTFNNNNSSNKFGSFIVQAAVDLEKRFRENALLMLSSECVSESSGSTGGWSTTGSNGLRCVCAYESGSAAGWEWSTDSNGLCGKCGQWCSVRVADGDDQVVFKMDDDDDHHNQQQQQQQLVLKLDNLGFPSCYQFDKIRRIGIAGSCNGLICIHDSEPHVSIVNHPHGNSDLLRDVSLWNPATRQFRILPKSITIAAATTDADAAAAAAVGDDGKIPPHRLVAFGFDAETKDYKVVLVTGFRPRTYYGIWGPVSPMECLCQVQVYSLSSDSWRLLEGIDSLPGYPFPYPNEVLYLNGSCFFMAKSFYSKQCIPVNNDRLIISLDLTKEIITTIQLPDHYRDQDLYLCYLGDKIALFTAAPYEGYDDNHDTTGGWWYEYYIIWVLNYEHGSSSSSSVVNKESWTKLHSFQIQLPKTLGDRNIPRGISNDGEFALLCKTQSMLFCDDDKMKLYNLVTKEVKKNFLSCSQVLSKAYAYKPSLVSITGGGNGSSSRISQLIYDRVIGGAM